MLLPALHVYYFTGLITYLCLSVYASKSDKYASLFPPTDGTFQQYTIKYQVALWIHSLEAKPVVCNPDSNG